MNEEQSEDEEILKFVEQPGWFGAAILDAVPPFIYTIGLMKTHSHPEIIVFGLDQDGANGLLSGLIHNIQAGAKYTERATLSVDIWGDQHRVGFRPVHKSQHVVYLGYALGFMRNIGRIGELEAVQAFWPDSKGHFPFEGGCDLDVHQLQPRLDIPLAKEEENDFFRKFT